MTLRINNVYESFGLEMPGTISLVLSVSGCNGSCPGCHSTALKDFNSGEEFDNDMMATLHTLLYKNKFYKNVVVIGGDITDAYKHDEESVIRFMNFIKSHEQLDLILYTRYELDQIPDDLKEYADYLKTGPYEENTPPRPESFLASGNQKMFKKNKAGEFEEINIPADG